MYNDKDLSAFIDKIDSREREVQANRNKYLTPTYEFLKIIENIIFDYIREKKRKIYGGYAQNKLIIQKEPKDKFYEDNIIADIDFYSPDPVQDIINLCNKFNELKYENISGSEAQHPETYTIFVEFEKVCDISYVPTNVFSRIPFVEIDGIHYCGAQFMMIDLYRSFTDPLVSGLLRWKKTFPRILTLQKHYEFQRATKKIQLPFEINDKQKELVLSIIHELKNKTSTILFGSYVYNCYIAETKINNDNNNNKIFNFLDLGYIEMISNDYVNDVKKIYNHLTTTFNHETTNLSVTEFHKFWILESYSTIIYYKEVPICKIIDYGEKCAPVKIIPFTLFDNNKVIKDDKNTIQIAAYDYNFVECLIAAFKCRVNKNDQWSYYYYVMISHLIFLRKYFFDKNQNKDMFDNTLFEQFMPNCIGKTTSSIRASMLEKLRRKAKHKIIVWKYTPETEPKKESHPFKYKNSSGNPITSPGKLKVFTK